MASGWIQIIFAIYDIVTRVKRIKNRIFDAAAAAAVVAAAADATTYCYPNKITQNLISVWQNSEYGYLNPT